MAKINRYGGNLQAFGSESQGNERTVFGDTTQDDTLDANITTEFLRGWGIVGVNENPTKQDFNALGYTVSQLVAYLHQAGVPEWHVEQEYFEGAVTITQAGVYRSLINGNIGNDPDADDGSNWELMPTAGQNTVDSVSELQAASFLASLTVIYLAGRTVLGDGGEGHFRWDSSDLSTEVSNDEVTTGEGDGGVYVAPASDKTGASGAWVRQFDGSVNVKWYGADGDGVSDDYQAIANAISHVESNGGGRVLFPVGTYGVSQTVMVSLNVWLQGDGWKFLNDYVDDGLVIGGSIIKLLDGSNTDVLRFRADISELDGDSYPRQHAGMRDIAVFGNRSSSHNPSIRDTNTAGSGILMQGTTYITLDNVLAFRCAEDGIRVDSHDYGDGNGARSCNNLNWRNVVSIGNYRDGYNIYAGDSVFAQLIAGYNGRDGFNTGAGPFHNCLAWNNKRNGAYISGEDQAFVGGRFYDNDFNGFRIDNAQEFSIIGCKIYSNGRAESGIREESAGVLIEGSGSDHIILDGNVIGNNPAPDNTQEYGVISDVQGIDLNLGTNTIQGNTSMDVDISSYTNVSMHGDVGSTASVKHPGFTASDDIFMDDQSVREMRGLSFNSWTMAAVNNSVLEVGSRSTMFLDIDGGASVSDITSTATGLFFMIVRNINSSGVVFQHDPAKIRMMGATDRTLDEDEAMMFVQISSGVWQQVGT